MDFREVREMERLWMFGADGEHVERECLLFEAGEYPDKGVKITAGDLREIAANSAGEIPVRIEHLPESPFDGALGVVTRLRVMGSQLWGTLRQPVEAWRLAQRAGARALSVGLDMERRRIVETSFVCRPRVSGAQVFREGCTVCFRTEELFAMTKGEYGTMLTARQFAEGLMGYLRGVLGGEEGEGVQFAREREALDAERARFREERAALQVMQWKREGRIRATERAESLAKALLTQGEGSLLTFGKERVAASALFAEFVAANGPVVLMGEMLAGDGAGGLRGGSAGETLARMAQEKARREGVSFVQAFAAVTAAHPEMALAAREE